VLSGRPLQGTSHDLDLFVDREGVMDRIHDSAARRLNTLVVGERRSGKTSLLRVLQGRLASRFHVVMLDAGLSHDAASFLSLFLFSLEREAALGRAGAVSNPRLDLDYSFALPATETERVLTLLDAVRHAIERRERGVVAIVDDLRTAELAHRLFGRMRDELWMLGCTWIVAADTQDRSALLRPPADAFFETVIELGPLDHRDAAELVRRRLADEDADPDLVERLARAGEGNPGRTIELAREVVVDGIPLGEATSRRTDVRFRAGKLGDSARRLVEDLLTYGPASASDESLLRRLNWTRARATQVFKQLEAEGIVGAVPARSGGGRKVYGLNLNGEA
jgi:hypothetical protein